MGYKVRWDSMSEGFLLKSEFGHVRITKDSSANGDRLMIQDIRTGKVGYLDPLELECLAWSNHEDLKDLLDPSLTRWKPGTEGEEDED